MKKDSFPALLAGSGLFLAATAFLYITHPELHRWVSPANLFAQSVLIVLIFLFSKIARQKLQKDGLTLPGPHSIFLLLSAVILLALLLLNRFVIQQFFNSADEHSCYFLAECFRRGKLFTAPHPLREFFTTPHVGDIAGKWFSVYPPGWPLLWAGALKLGFGSWANPLLLSAAFYLVLRQAQSIYGAKAAAWAGILCLASPFFVLTGAAYYSHNTALLCLAFFLTATLHWQEKHDARWALLAGFALGYGLLTRYLTVAAFALPLMVYAFQKSLHQKKFQGWVLFSTAVVITQIFHLAYNAAITGNPLNPPNHFLHSHEKLGFIAGYTPVTALQYLGQRILYLMDWTPPLLVVVFILSFLQHKSDPRRKVISQCVLAVPIAYLFYYSWGGNQFGPRYYFEVYPWLVLEAAAVLFCEEPSLTPSSLQLRRMTRGLILASAFAVLVFQASWVKKMSFERKTFYDQVAAEVQKPALIFIHGFLGDTLVMSQEDSVRNSPFLDTEIIYAADRGAENPRLQSAFPKHNAYRASFDRTVHKALLEKLPSPPQ